VVEVLSEGTAAFDRGEKFQAYQLVESLQEYVLVSQDKHLIEQYVRQTNGSWTYRATVGQDSSVTLPSIMCTLSLKSVYDKTK
jgi:Uma2 family endonuclease